MKQMALIGTLRRQLHPVFFLVLAPVLLYAQAFDTTPPVISHQPQKLGRQSKPLPLSAHIADPSGIKSVQLKISYEGESFEGSMPVINESVPVVIKILNDQYPIYAGPGSNFKKMGTLLLDEEVNVTLVRDSFYRIRSSRGLYGYVSNVSTEVVLRGKLYGVTVPANITQSAFLTYQIIAIDMFGNETKTPPVEVRLIDEKQLARLQAQAGLTPRTKTAGANVRSLDTRKAVPFYSKPTFWLATLAAGGGAYYYFSRQEDKEKDATVNLMIEW